MTFSKACERPPEDPGKYLATDAPAYPCYPEPESSRSCKPTVPCADMNLVRFGAYRWRTKRGDPSYRVAPSESMRNPQGFTASVPWLCVPRATRPSAVSEPR